MDTIREHKALYIFEGIALAILGMLAIALPVMFTFGIALLVGCLCIVGGIIELARTFKAANVPGFIFSLLTGLLYLIVGVLLIYNPLAGALTLTMLLTAFFILEGIAKIAWGIKMRPLTGWGWLVASGIIALIMAGIIIAGWPQTALWVIGLLVGIDLLFFGLSLVTIAMSVPSAEKR